MNETTWMMCGTLFGLLYHAMRCQPCMQWSGDTAFLPASPAKCFSLFTMQVEETTQCCSVYMTNITLHG
jgi:hypothetical protein